MFSEGNGYVIYWDTIQHVIKQNVDRLKLVIALKMFAWYVTLQSTNNAHCSVFKNNPSVKHIIMCIVFLFLSVAKQILRDRFCHCMKYHVLNVGQFILLLLIGNVQ